MFDVFFLAIALAMDAFAVSIGLGTKLTFIKPVKIHSQSLLIAGYFGFFQGVMPLIGYLFGQSLLGLATDFMPWIACIILLILGMKMCYEAWFDDNAGADSTEIESAEKLKGAEDRETSANSMSTHQQLLLLSLTTSLDAMGAGFSFNLLPINVWLGCFIIALVTGILSIIGVYLGSSFGRLLGKNLEKFAETLGGILLIGIGINILLH